MGQKKLIIVDTDILIDLSFVSKNQRDYRFIENLKLLPYSGPFSKNEDQAE